MIKAYVTVKGDWSVGINDQIFTVDGLDIDDDNHRQDCVDALKVCFARITGERVSRVKVRFDDEYTPEEALEELEKLKVFTKKNWKVEGLTDTYENEQRN